MTPEPQFYSVREFCEAHSLSRSFLYRLWRAGKGPGRVKVGSRTFITREAAERWAASLQAGKRVA